MKATTTRTLNPLPFQDLEPHRFEDLVRQLAYEFRPWKSLEATGRGGADDGLDIRAVESPLNSEEDDDSEVGPVVPDRLWVFQCKRERSLTPKRIREVIVESLRSLTVPPHGFILAIACDVTKKTRDIFREEMIARSINEFLIWSKSELEDMLFQARNDRLLFAYFGLSLQTKRRSLSTSVRAQVIRKKQLITLLGRENQMGTWVLLRDPTDERYLAGPTSVSSGRWLMCRAMTVKNPGRLTLLCGEHPAATTPDGMQWDAIREYNLADDLARAELMRRSAWLDDVVEDRGRGREICDFWEEYIPSPDQARLQVVRQVSLDDILALDPDGDGYYPIPQIFVQFRAGSGPFMPGETLYLKQSLSLWGDRATAVPRSDNRANIFPRPLPNSLDSAPGGFDQTMDTSAQLTETTRQQFNSLTEAVSGDSHPESGDVAEPGPRLGIMYDLAHFRDWCESVARPLFSAFVHSLREQGHYARVVIRSVQAVQYEHNGSEYVELRIRLKRAMRADSMVGYVQVQMSDNIAPQIHVSPRPEEGRSPNSSRESIGTIWEITQQRLENEVISCLAGLTSRTFRAK